MIEIQKILSEVSKTKMAFKIANQNFGSKIAPKFSIFRYLATNELGLSKILADLLNPESHHSQSKLFIKTFLEFFLADALAQAEIDLEQAKYTIKLEELTIASGIPRRMDILIEIFYNQKIYRICIENKPFAYDQNEQLVAYARELDIRRPQGGWHIIYLSGSGSGPTSSSVNPALLEQWKEDLNYTQINIGQLVEWLQGTFGFIENEAVQFFIKELIKYINTKFNGFRDMTERNAMIDIFTANEDNLKSTFEILKYKDALQAKLMQEFNEQLENACRKHNLIFRGKLSDAPKSKFVIQFDNQQSSFEFAAQFKVGNYREFVFGWKRVGTSKYYDESLWKEVHSLAQTTFSEFRHITRTEWWLFSVEDHLSDWHKNMAAWLDIRNHVLSEKIIQTALKTQQMLKQINSPEAK